MMNKMFGDLAGDVMGILPATTESQQRGNVVDNLIKTLFTLLQEFRAENNWQKADEIRHRLAELGITIEDGPESTTWRWQ
jgi:cysteinyl-tRNA synthetase